jgi:NAD(P)-dependent dehydrogenase (short-subunit alcohol dehydrogenase family)
MTPPQKVALITGASRGIGAALVTAYRELGYAVTATARSIAESDDPLVLAAPGDVSEPGVGDRIVAATVKRFGRIDTLVNNAGIFISKPFIDYTDDDYDAITGVNVRGFFEFTRSAARAMLAQNGGLVVNVSTTLVENADARVPSALTSLTKGGLNAATRALAIEYATRGIRVNAVSLGIIKTSIRPEDADAYESALEPVGRMGDIADVVSAILYLENAPFVTGEILHVDGGQSAGH